MRTTKAQELWACLIAVTHVFDLFCNASAKDAQTPPPRRLRVPFQKLLLLARAVNEGILESYNLKGGVALELRFAEGARATKDIDIGVPGERTNWM